MSTPSEVDEIFESNEVIAKYNRQLDEIFESNGDKLRELEDLYKSSDGMTLFLVTALSLYAARQTRNKDKSE